MTQRPDFLPERLPSAGVSFLSFPTFLTFLHLHPRAAMTSAGTAPRMAAIDWLYLTLPGVIWGASFLFIAEGLRSIGPNGVTFVRILVGFVTLSLLPASRRPVPRSDWGAVALLAVLWMAFPLSMFPYAEQRVSSALTGMLNGSVPLFAALVASGISRRPP